MSEAESKEMELFGSQDAVPAYLQGGAGAGNEHVGNKDVAIPRINLLQALSPQIDTVPNARAGMLHNSITDELYSELLVVNLLFAHEYSVFKRRELGGGYEGKFKTRQLAEEHLAAIGAKPTDYEIKETARHIVLLLDAEGKPMQPAEVLMSGTKLRVSATWNSEIMLKGKDVARFATVWRLSSVKQSNSKGTWYNLDVEWVGWAPPELYAEAQSFYERAKAGL